MSRIGVIVLRTGSWFGTVHPENGVGLVLAVVVAMETWGGVLNVVTIGTEEGVWHVVVGR